MIEIFKLYLLDDMDAKICLKKRLSEEKVALHQNLFFCLIYN